MGVKKARSYKIWKKLKITENQDSSTVFVRQERGLMIACLTHLGEFLGKVKFRGKECPDCKVAR